MRAFVDSTPVGVVLGLFLISVQCFDFYVNLLPVRDFLSTPSSGLSDCPLGDTLPLPQSIWAHRYQSRNPLPSHSPISQDRQRICKSSLSTCRLPCSSRRTEQSRANHYGTFKIMEHVPTSSEKPKMEPIKTLWSSQHTIYSHVSEDLFFSVWSCPHDLQLFNSHTTFNDTHPDSQRLSRYHQLRRVLDLMGLVKLRGLLMRTLAGYLAYVRQPRFWLSAQVAAEERPTDRSSTAQTSETVV